MRLNDAAKERFWSRVDRSASPCGCWNWTSCVTPRGYGQISINAKKNYAHRVAYELSVGPIPDGMLVLHSCDNRRCVNPKHLRVGTPKENTADMDIRGRRVNTPSLGEKHGCAKLTEAVVKDIRERHRSGAIESALAVLYGVSPRTVGRVVSRHSWRHVA